MQSQAAQICSSVTQLSSMAAPRNDPEKMIMGRRELLVLLTNHPKLLDALMNFRRRKPMVGGMTHRDSSHLILESVSSTITLSLGTERGGRWVIPGDNSELQWAGLQAWEGLLLQRAFLGQGVVLKIG